MRHLLALAAVAAGIAAAPPAASACGLEHCPVTSTVCRVANCSPGLFCDQVGEWLYVCI